MTELDLQIADLRAKRQKPPFSLKAWIRSLRPFDRRAIREPAERDAYWAIVQQRLAESDAGYLRRQLASERPSAASPLIG